LITKDVLGGNRISIANAASQSQRLVEVQANLEGDLEENRKHVDKDLADFGVENILQLRYVGEDRGNSRLCMTPRQRSKTWDRDSEEELNCPNDLNEVLLDCRSTSLVNGHRDVEG